MCKCCWIAVHVQDALLQAGLLLMVLALLLLAFAVPLCPPWGKGQTSVPQEVPVLRHCMPRVPQGEQAGSGELSSFLAPCTCVCFSPLARVWSQPMQVQWTWGIL
jgi:hypothetical protein